MIMRVTMVTLIDVNVLRFILKVAVINPPDCYAQGLINVRRKETSRSKRGHNVNHLVRHKCRGIRRHQNNQGLQSSDL